MALSEAVAIERLAAADMAAGLALSDAAGWNQTGEDWAVFIEHGHAIGCRDGTGRLVATAAALPYGASLGWISMVLVAADHRHRGLATALLGDCLRSLADSGRVAVLDATPAGAPVYRRLGFLSGFGFERWHGDGGARTGASSPAQVVGAAESDRAGIAALDAAACGVPREFLLRALLARPDTRAWLTADRSGFVIARAGRRATQVGPVVARSEQEAIGLIDSAVSAATGRVFADVPQRCTALAAALARRGFTQQRPFVRMASADAPVLVASEGVFALAGPEFG